MGRASVAWRVSVVGRVSVAGRAALGVTGDIGWYIGWGESRIIGDGGSMSSLSGSSQWSAGKSFADARGTGAVAGGWAGGWAEGPEVGVGASSSTISTSSGASSAIGLG